MEEDQNRLVAQNAAPVAIPMEKIKYESGIDPELNLVRDCVQEGKKTFAVPTKWLGTNRYWWENLFLGEIE